MHQRQIIQETDMFSVEISVLHYVFCSFWFALLYRGVIFI